MTVFLLFWVIEYRGRKPGRESGPYGGSLHAYCVSVRVTQVGQLEYLAKRLLFFLSYWILSV